MKITKVLKTLAMGMVVALAFVGCKNNLTDIDSNTDAGKSKTEVGQKIQQMKNAGLFDEILKSSARSAESNEESEKINRFINNTDEVLDEIASSEDADVQMEFINILFNDGTVGDMSDALEKYAPELADEYIDAMQKLSENMDLNECSRSAYSTNIRDVKLCYMLDVCSDNNARKAFATDFDNDTLGWYYGFCATTY